MEAIVKGETQDFIASLVASGHFGEVMRSYRERVLERSQEYVARSIGTSSRTIHRWEKNLSKPSPLALSHLAALAPAGALPFLDYADQEWSSLATSQTACCGGWVLD